MKRAVVKTNEIIKAHHEIISSPKMPSHFAFTEFESIDETGTVIPKSSAVDHPSHYNSGKIEVIEAIEDWKLGYHLGNTVKYCARAGKKDPTKEVEDLEKAAWYLKRKIELLKAEKENRETTRPNDMNPRNA